MGGRVLGLSPAQRDARSSVQSAVAQFPARATTGKVAAGLKPPDDLPPFRGTPLRRKLFLYLVPET